MQPDWSSQIITIYLIRQFKPVKWYSFLFTALSHWYPHIICNKGLYFISTEIYPQRWQWWKNRSVFSRSRTEPDVKLLQTLLGTRNGLLLEFKEYICMFIISVRSKDRKDYEESMSLLCSEVFTQVFVLSLLIVIFVWKKSQYLWSKHITGWKMLCVFFSLVSYQKIHSFAALTRFLILLNSWIKIVRAHFPWSNLYGRFPLLRNLYVRTDVNFNWLWARFNFYVYARLFIHHLC